MFKSESRECVTLFTLLLQLLLLIITDSDLELAENKKNESHNMLFITGWFVVV